MAILSAAAPAAAAALVKKVVWAELPPEALRLFSDLQLAGGFGQQPPTPSAVLAWQRVGDFAARLVEMLMHKLNAVKPVAGGKGKECFAFLHHL